MPIRPLSSHRDVCSRYRRWPRQSIADGYPGGGYSIPETTGHKEVGDGEGDYKAKSRSGDIDNDHSFGPVYCLGHRFGHRIFLFLFWILSSFIIWDVLKKDRLP